MVLAALLVSTPAFAQAGEHCAAAVTDQELDRHLAKASAAFETWDELVGWRGVGPRMDALHGALGCLAVVPEPHRLGRLYLLEGMAVYADNADDTDAVSVLFAAARQALSDTAFPKSWKLEYTLPERLLEEARGGGPTRPLPPLAAGVWSVDGVESDTAPALRYALVQRVRDGSVLSSTWLAPDAQPPVASHEVLSADEVRNQELQELAARRRVEEHRYRAVASREWHSVLQLISADMPEAEDRVRAFVDKHADARLQGGGVIFRIPGLPEARAWLAVMSDIRRQEASAERCQRKVGRKAGTKVSGHVNVAWAVADGRARNVRVVDNSTGSEGLGSCLVDAIATWSFPSAEAVPGGDIRLDPTPRDEPDANPAPASWTQIRHLFVFEG